MVRALVVAIVLSACSYDLSIEHCAVVCAADDRACPEGLTCGPEGLCRADTASACLLASDGLGGVITHVAGRSIHTFSMADSGSTFLPPADLSTVELLVVGGGGGGGSTRGGGGAGAGGLVHIQSVAITQPGYVVLMGFGGGPGTSGGNSSFGTIVAIGGGAGQPSSTPNGGSGGGAGHEGGGGTGTAGQGNRGGLGGYSAIPIVFAGAGGGGAGGAGANGSSSGGGMGGPGLAVAISGELLYYAGGGAGGGNQATVDQGLSPGVGGIGGGGDGGLDAIGKDGADGTGGGGGGGGGGPDPNFFRGGRGGNGVVIVSYPTQR